MFLNENFDRDFTYIDIDGLNREIQCANHFLENFPCVPKKYTFFYISQILIYLDDKNYLFCWQ